MKILLIPIFLIFIGFANLFSQEAVVSEIFIASGANSEWTELLIIQDNISLVGYSIRDNGTEGVWMGGIRFKDVDLWKNLRAGTIIIIYHRGNIIDEHKEDGYIEIGATSSYYFDTFLPDGTPGPLEVGNINSLNFNATRDLIQLRNSKDEHVHCLGYAGGKYDVYDQLPSTKAFIISGANFNQSVKIAPGANLAAYSAGLDASQVTNQGIVTKGLPNKRSNTDFINQLYWRELRQPIWNNPGIISTSIVNNYNWVELKWNAASTYSDPVEGFIIVRYVDNNNNPLTLEDGKIYTVGQRIGLYTVIGIVETLTKTDFIDKFEDGISFDCGRYYGYQIYAYRYRQSDFDPQTYDYLDVRNARGRQYNETSFASVSQAIRKEIPPTPSINTDSGVLKFCSNVSVNLESNIKDKVKYNYEWSSSTDGVLPINDFRVPLTKPGDYFLKIIDKSSGCFAISNSIKIEILQSPDAYVINNADGRTFQRDTLIQLCEGQVLNLRGLSLPSGSGISTQWIKDNVFYNNSNDVAINQEGLYKFISVAGGLCPDTSISVRVRFVNPDYVLSASKLIFDADNSAEQDLIITNNSDKELIINSNDINLTPVNNYRLISPTIFPVNIAPKGTATFRIKFEMIGFGERIGKITISSICNYNKSTDLEGSRQNIGTTRLDPDLQEIDFGLVPLRCDIDLNDTSVYVISTGSLNALLYKPVLNTNAFEVVSNLFNTTEKRTAIAAGQQISFGIKVIATSPGIYYDTLVAPYILQGKTDTAGYVRVNLKVELFDPSIELITNEIDYSNNVTCKKTLDTFLIVRNPSPKDIEITDNIADPRISITEPLPYIIPKGKLDTINIRLLFTDNINFTFNIDYYNYCGLSSDEILIIPPKIDLDIKLEKDTIDFGIINNCEYSGDLIKSAVINSSAIGGSIGSIIYNSSNIKSDLFKGKILSIGANSFDIRLPANVEGLILDSLVFIVEPCNEKFVLYLKANRINPPKPVFSTSNVDFGTNNVYFGETRNWTVINENLYLPMKLDSLVVPLPFVMISHNSADFPILIPPGGSVDFVFEYKRLTVGTPNLILTLHESLPCKNKFDIVIKGVSYDNRNATLRALLPPQETIELGSEKKLPIRIEIDKNYPVSEIEIRSMVFYLSFDYLTMNLRAAVKGEAINSPTSQLLFDDSFDGKLVLTLNVTEPNNIIEGDLVMLTAKPLLGNDTKSKIKLDSVKISSRMPATVETNESDITITGDCDLESRLISVGGSVGITVKNIEGNEQLSISYSVISDERTNIELYNIQGENIGKIVDSFLKPGDYTKILNLNKLNSGIYFLVLRNGIRYSTVYFPVVK